MRDVLRAVETRVRPQVNFLVETGKRRTLMTEFIVLRNKTSSSLYIVCREITQHRQLKRCDEKKEVRDELHHDDEKLGFASIQERSKGEL